MTLTAFLLRAVGVAGGLSLATAGGFAAYDALSGITTPANAGNMAPVAFTDASGTHRIVADTGLGGQVILHDHAPDPAPSAAPAATSGPEAGPSEPSSGGDAPVMTVPPASPAAPSASPPPAPPAKVIVAAPPVTIVRAGPAAAEVEQREVEHQLERAERDAMRAERAQIAAARRHTHQAVRERD